MSNNSQYINISAKNIQGKCDFKCAYNFKYSESNLTAKNDGVMISLTYDNSSVPPVLYNNQEYTVSNIYITCPSIHLFNNSTAAAEIVIEHTPVKGGNLLCVGIPMASSTESSTSSNLITDIIQSVSTNAPAQGESTNMNISGFTLQNIVPNKPFYSYTAPDTNYDWIVFGALESIPLNSGTLSTLSQIIKPFPITTPGNGLFYNSSGPNSTGGNQGDIYISCQPTGSSKDEVPVTYDKNTTNYDLGSIFTSIINNPNSFIVLQIFLAIIVFLILFLIINYVYNYFTSDAQKLPTFNIPKIPGIN
jgi:hypothetical protein